MLSFKGDIDHAVLQQELIAAIGTQDIAGWYLNGAQGEVTFIATKNTTPDPTPTINAHIANAFQRKKNAAVARIKQEASDIIRDVILNLGTEYQSTKDAADAYHAAGYIGTVPELVQSWADAKIPVQTPQWACDDIRTTASSWEGAQEQIRRNRLRFQEMTKAAFDQAGIDSAYSYWTTFKNTIRTQLGV